MGKIKEIVMEILENNGGVIPPGYSISDHIKEKQSKIKKMKKLIIIVILMVTSSVANAQGIITVKDNKVDVPVAQWYVIRTKEYDSYSFFYAEHEEAREELKKILSQDDQSIEFPKGKDEDGDDYWIILYENEFLSHIYLTKEDKFTLITIFTE
jgi:hypothetical protein